MAVRTELQRAPLGDLLLDGKNPRLGRATRGEDLSQEQILEIMRDWALEELAISFLDNGYWPQEALIVVREPAGLVVVEGNRRLAALKWLFRARQDPTAPRKWRDIVADVDQQKFDDLSNVPYLLADRRDDVVAYLGFRHVTGIKPWKPVEKAEYIASLIEDHGMSYQGVMRAIGSKTPTVRQHYITYRLLLQMEQQEDAIDIQRVENKFSVLYLSLRSRGTQQYLGLSLNLEPQQALQPVNPDRLGNLAKFALWLFGDDDRPPVVTDSRMVDRFGEILESPEAVGYLERSESPQFETAYRKSGIDERDTVLAVQRASDYVREALTSAHRLRASAAMVRAVRSFGVDALQLLSIFPEVHLELVQRTE